MAHLSKDANMISAFLSFCRHSFGAMYPLAAAGAGIRMGFISGSETLPVQMLTRYHLEAADAIFKPGGAGTFIAAASAMAASLMMLINPARLQNAAAVIGQTGYETRAWRSTFVIALLCIICIAIIALKLCSV